MLPLQFVECRRVKLLLSHQNERGAGVSRAAPSTPRLPLAFWLACLNSGVKGLGNALELYLVCVGAPSARALRLFETGFRGSPEDLPVSVQFRSVCSLRSHKPDVAVYAALGPWVKGAAWLTENLRTYSDADARSRRSAKIPFTFHFPSWCELSPGQVRMALSSILISVDYSVVRSGSIAGRKHLDGASAKASEKCQPSQNRRTVCSHPCTHTRAVGGC